MTMLSRVLSVLFLCTISLSATTTSQAVELSSGVPDELEGRILAQVEQYSADVWCDEETKYQFEKISCNPSRQECTFFFQMLRTHGRSLSARCPLAEYSTPSQLLESLPFLNDQESIVIKRDVYEKLNNCIFALVDQLQSIP